jgi:hypothetical protein
MSRTPFLLLQRPLHRYVTLEKSRVCRIHVVDPDVDLGSLASFGGSLLHSYAEPFIPPDRQVVALFDEKLESDDIDEQAALGI